MANKKRLIDADALRQKWASERDFMLNRWGGYGALLNREKGRVDELDACIADVEAAPTVDAVPAAHSEWVCVNEDENVWMCDGIEGCGGEMVILEKTPLENGFHFCPYCGADMRERSEGE